VLDWLQGVNDGKVSLNELKSIQWQISWLFQRLTLLSWNPMTFVINWSNLLGKCFSHDKENLPD